jgi:hypothetical protein
MHQMERRSLASVGWFWTYEGGLDMFKRNPNGAFLARMLAGLTLAMTIVIGSLGYALHNSQAFL